MVTKLKKLTGIHLNVYNNIARYEETALSFLQRSSNYSGTLIKIACNDLLDAGLIERVQSQEIKYKIK